jgi:TP901-1 family phage major tail protein
MEHYKGQDRILCFKIDGLFIPVACLTDNAFSENVDTIDTTTRENNGWSTARPVYQSYSISFNGLQILTTLTGDTLKASYDRLKTLKRDRVLLDWLIKGADYPVVDYGKCYITELSEAAVVNEFITFSGTLTGYGLTYSTTEGVLLLNNGDPTTIVQDGNTNLIQVT